MASFFSLITELEVLLDQLNTILSGSDNETVEVNGVTKDSISKAIKDSFSAIQAQVQGRLSFITKAELDAYGEPANNELAEVWNDPIESNNGLYGYLGDSWNKSPYDKYEALSSLQNKLKVSLSNITQATENTSTKTSPSSIPTTDGDVVYAIADKDGNLLLSISDDGKVKFYLDASISDQILLKKDDSGRAGLSSMNDALVSVGFDEDDKFFVKDLYVESRDLDNYLYAIADENGRIALSIDKNGLLDFFISESLRNKINGINDRDLADHYYAISDENGRIALSINKQGLLDFSFSQNLTRKIKNINETTLSDYEYVITDESGNVALSINKNGECDILPTASLLDYVEDNINKNIETTLTEITHIQMHGQSLSLGNGTSNISTESAQGVLMPNQGLYDGQTGSADGLAGLPFISDGFSLMTSEYGSEGKEPPIIGACEQLQYLLDSHFGSRKTTVFGSLSGHGGYPIRYLDKEGDPSVGSPSPNYDLLHKQQNHYVEMKSTAGQSLLTQALLWIQGETDISQGTSKNEYKIRLKNLINDYANDCAQNYAPFLLTYQVSSHTRRTPNHERDIALAQLELSEEEKNIFMACPTYVFPYLGDGVHLQSHSSRWLGTYFGKALFNILTKGNFSPLRPKSLLRTGRVITIKFDVPVPPLALDTELVTDPGDFGFEVYSGDIKLGISSVSVSGIDQIKIVLDDSPESKVTVKYAVGETGNLAGPETGARGNLRDSDITENYYSSTNGYDYSLYNWCVIFDLQEK